MSPYSTPILCRASVAGPVKGGVVASWRNTSRNCLSAVIKTSIFTVLAPPVACHHAPLPVTPRRSSAEERTNRRLFRRRLQFQVALQHHDLIRVPRRHRVVDPTAIGLAS